MLSGSGSPQGSRTMRQAAINHMNDEDCYTLYQFAGLDTTDDMQVLLTKIWFHLVTDPLVFTQSLDGKIYFVYSLHFKYLSEHFSVLELATTIKDLKAPVMAILADPWIATLTENG